jgi:hypothetical protein
MAIAGVLAQAGCATLALVSAALVAGLWLDGRFDTRPLFTLLLVLASVPVTMFLLYRIAVTGAARLQRQAGPSAPPEEEEREHGKSS